MVDRKSIGAALGALVVGLVAYTAPAQAHPHVFVAVRSEVLFAPDGLVKGVRHSWTFDEMYSAFAVQGLGKDGKPTQDELDALAKVNATQLMDNEYFTALRIAGKKVEFGPATEATMTLDDKKNVTLHFVVPLKQPANARTVVLQVFDPDYFVAFDFEKTNPVRMSGAPAGCSLRLVTPKPLEDADRKKLNDSAGTNISPGADFGMKLATRAFIACP